MNIDKKIWNELMSAQEELIEECTCAYSRMDAHRCEFEELGKLEKKLAKIVARIENNGSRGDGSYEDNIAFSPKINRD